MKKRTIIIVVSVIVIALGSFIILNRKPAEDPPVRCAFDTWLGYSSFYIADELGYFEDEQLDVELRIINPLQEKNVAMIKGDIDVMGGSIDSAIISNSSGASGQIVFVFEASNGNDTLITSDDIKSAQDLEQQKIAVEIGYVSHLFLLHYLDLNGLSPDDVRIVDMPNDQSAAAFVSGGIDAVSTWEPFTTQAMNRPDARILASSKDMQPLFCGTLYASDKFIQEQPEKLRKLVTALLRANAYWEANPVEGNKIVARRWNMPEQEVADIMVNTNLYTLEDQHHLFGTDNEPGTLLEYLGICDHLWRSAGEIENEINHRNVFSGDFLPEE